MIAVLAQMAGDGLTFTDQTTLHPVGGSMLLIGLLAILLLPRKYAIVPLAVMMVIIPSAQRISVIGMDFTLLRLLILGGLARVTLRQEWADLKLRPVDYLILAWAIWAVLAYGVQMGSVNSMVTRTGYMIDAVGGYFLGRSLLRDAKAWQQLMLWLAIAAVPVAVLFLMERASGRNLFSVFGGVPEVTMIRQGRLRCQGPFSHPIMAGVFWASILPMFVAFLLSAPRLRPAMLMGLGASGVIVLSTASSTPVMAVMLGIGAMGLFYARSLTPAIRWSVLAAIPALHVVMDKGVHHLLARINVVGGSTGWHRYHLMDAAMKNVTDWFLVGIPYTGHWGWGLIDVTNQFVLEGVRGGMLALILFSAWIIAMFVEISRSIRGSVGIESKIVVWACGSMLFVHCLNFIAVSYFGQMTAAFYAFSGAGVSLAIDSLKRDSGTVPSAAAATKAVSFFEPPRGTRAYSCD